MSRRSQTPARPLAALVRLTAKEQAWIARRLDSSARPCHSLRHALHTSAIAALEQSGEADWLEERRGEEYPEVVREAVATIRNVVRSVQWFRMGDPRANVVEPQLGYILRNLEMDLQQGVGAGHGLLAVYEPSQEDATC